MEGTEGSNSHSAHLKLPLLLVPPRLKGLERRRLNHALVEVTLENVL